MTREIFLDMCERKDILRRYPTDAQVDIMAAATGMWPSPDADVQKFRSSIRWILYDSLNKTVVPVCLFLLFDVATSFLPCQCEPSPGNGTVKHIAVPKSPYRVRIWLEEDQKDECTFCFVNASDTSVALPKDYILWPVLPSDWVGPPAARLASVESQLGFGLRDQRFVAPEGVTVELRRPGYASMRFVISPRRS